MGMLQRHEKRRFLWWLQKIHSRLRGDQRCGPKGGLSGVLGSKAWGVEVSQARGFGVSQKPTWNGLRGRGFASGFGRASVLRREGRICGSGRKMAAEALRLMGAMARTSQQPATYYKTRGNILHAQAPKCENSVPP